MIKYQSQLINTSLQTAKNSKSYNVIWNMRHQNSEIRSVVESVSGFEIFVMPLAVIIVSGYNPYVVGGICKCNSADHHRNYYEKGLECEVM